MTKIVMIWEAPRFRGTCLAFAVSNGLVSVGKSVAFMDEPLHWRRFLPGPTPSESTRLDVLLDKIDKVDADFVVIKMQAKQLFQTDPPFRFSYHPIILKSHHLILVRDTFGALVSHQKALRQMSDIPTELTFEGSGIKQLHKVYRAFCGNSDVRFSGVDTDAVAALPQNEMRRLALKLGIPFSDAMVYWPSVTIEPPPWGRHWYADLMKSRGWRAPSVLASDDLALAHDLWKQLDPLVCEMRAGSIDGESR